MKKLLIPLLLVNVASWAGGNEHCSHITIKNNSGITLTVEKPSGSDYWQCIDTDWSSSTNKFTIKPGDEATTKICASYRFSNFCTLGHSWQMFDITRSDDNRKASMLWFYGNGANTIEETAEKRVQTFGWKYYYGYICKKSGTSSGYSDHTLYLQRMTTDKNSQKMMPFDYGSVEETYDSKQDYCNYKVTVDS